MYLNRQHNDSEYFNVLDIIGVFKLSHLGFGTTQLAKNIENKNNLTREYFSRFTLDTIKLK